MLAELTVKVLPAPEATQTIAFHPDGTAQALEAIARIGRGPVEADAVDLEPAGALLVRLAGRAAPLPARVERLIGLLGLPAERVDEAAWDPAQTLSWAPADAALVRVGLTATSVPALERALAGATWRLSVGANVAWIAWPGDRAIAELDAALAEAGVSGLVLRGADRPLLGVRRGGAFAQRLRAALDPDRRFLEA